MSSLRNGQSPRPSRAVPLGRLLVARGLLTEQQLIDGLLEQDRTGDRLGQVLIRLGFVDAQSVAMALASQHGGPLETEYGFATGFDSDGPFEPAIEPPPSPATFQPPPPDLRPADTPDVSPPTEPQVMEAAMAAASTQTRPATMPAPVATGAGEIEGPPRETASGDRQAFPAEHDQAPGQIDAIVADREAALRAELGAAHTRIADLERELATARAQLDERRSKTAELEERVAGARIAAETAIAALRGVAEVPS